MDQKLADLLVAFDEKLRGGLAEYGDLTPRIAPDDTDTAELRNLLDCVQILESRWPRTAMGDPARVDMLPRGEIVPPAPGIVKQKVVSRIGRFEIECVLGEGGFGIVYLAQDPALHRQIALKVPRVSSLAGSKTRERFRREAHAAATLDHPNIVPIYEAGEEGTICYIASAYCQGPNLAQWLKEQNSPVCPRLAAAVISRLADAAHYSHTRGVLHRDLKPSNVMLVSQTSGASSTGPDDLPFVPRLTDFGLAKLLDEDRDESVASAMFGTPSYMAPEQAEGSVERVGPHTDVYALGVILYEMLVGRPPFQGANVIDVLDEVRNGELVPPRRLRRDVPRDLEIICLKCIEKRPSRRYATAAELSEDLHRFLLGEPVRARRPSAIDSAIKRLRRRPAIAVAMAVTAFAILIVLVGGWYSNRHLAHALHVAERLRGETLLREQQLRVQMYAADLRLAWKAWEAGDMDEMLTHLNPYLPRAGDKDLRGFEWHLLRAGSQADVRILQGHLAPILTVDISPDDKLIASGDRGGTVRICELATGREVKSLQYSVQEVTWVGFAPDGQTLATAGQDRTIRMWNVNDWSEIACLRGHDLTVTAVTWSPDGKQLASSGRDNQIKIWDTIRQCEVKSLEEQPDVVRTVAWSPDGKMLAAGIREVGLKLWNTSNWRLISSQSLVGTGGVLALAFSPDSKRLASAGYGGNLLLHDVSTLKAIAEVDLSNTVWSLCFSPDGRMLIAGRGDGLANLWEAQTTEGELAELRTIQTGEGAVRGVAFGSGGQFVVTAMEQDRLLQVRSTSELAVCRPYHFTPACRDVAGKMNRVILLDATGTMSLASLMQGQPDNLRQPQLSPVHDAVFFPQGDLLAASGAETGVLIYDATNLELRDCLDTKEKVRSISVSPDGKRISGSSESGTVWLWTVGTRSPSLQLGGHHTPTVHTAFSSDGKLLASASLNEQQIILWDAATGSRIADLQAAQGITALAFSPDGNTLAIAGLDHIVMLWDVSSRSKVSVLRGHVNAVRAVAYCPSGQTLATVGDDGTVRLWHVSTQQELCILARRSLPLHWVRFLSPRQLVVGTASYGSGAQSSNDVLGFDTGKLQPNNRGRLSLNGPGSQPATTIPTDDSQTRSNVGEQRIPLPAQ